MSTLKDSTYNTPTALTITLASLPNQSGRQSTEVDNTTTRFQRIEISVTVKLGPSPAPSEGVYVYAIRNNNAATPIRDDNAGPTDAAWAPKSALLLGVLATGLAPNTGDVLNDNFIFFDPGAKWAVGIYNFSASSLDATPANHVVSYNGITTTIA